MQIPPHCFYLAPFVIYAFINTSNYFINISVRNEFIKAKQDMFKQLLQRGLIQKAALYAALAEVLILPLLIVRYLTVGGTIFSMLMYSQILLTRFRLSNYTREACYIIDSKICSIIAMPIVPLFIRNSYYSLRAWLMRFTSNTQQ